MASMNVSLPEPLKVWAESQVESGRYNNTSDYVRDLIRKDQDRAGKIAELQRMIDEGIASGESAPFDFDVFLSAMSAKHAAKRK